MTERGRRNWRATPEVRQQARDLRKEQTPAEAVLWKQLRGKLLTGTRFRRQHPVGPYVVDFFCADCGLVVEVDGDSHAEQEAYDLARTAWLEERGYRVIRFTNLEVQRQLEAVLEEIAEACKGGPHPASPAAAGEEREHPHPTSPAAAGEEKERLHAASQAAAGEGMKKL